MGTEPCWIRAAFRGSWPCASGGCWPLEAPGAPPRPERRAAPERIATRAPSVAPAAPEPAPPATPADGGTGTPPAAVAPPRVPEPQAPPPAPEAPTAAACTERARRDPGDGVTCFLQRAGGAGVDAQIALYEAARLRRDRLDDSAGALATFFEHRRRFPTGALRPEVDLSIVELLPKLGRYREALEESAALLARGAAGGERPGELHLLRGNIYREALGDCRHAEEEYARAAASSGRAADGAAFWRAVCLETLGRDGDAVSAYRAYLYMARPAAAHAAEARRRLQALTKESGRESEHSPGGAL